MNLTLDENHATYYIRSYKVGAVQVNEQVFTHSIIVGPDKLIEEWAPQSFAELNHAHLMEALALLPDILIIGTGATQHFPPVALYADILNKGIGVEIMDSAAACRTFNILTSEGRNAVMALIIK